MHFKLTKRWLSLLAFVALTATLAAGVLIPRQYYPAKQKLPHAFIIKNAHVVDAAGGTIHANRQLIIRDGIIERIDTAVHAYSDGLDVIDAHGQYLVPSFWDMHVHTLSLSPQLHFPLLIANGVTHMRDMGDGDSWKSDMQDNDLRDKTIWEEMERSRGLLKPHIMEATSFHLEEVGALDEHNTQAMAHQIVSTLKARHEPFIKVQLTEGDYPTEFFYDLQREADKQGIPVLGHLPADVDIHRVLKNKFRSIEHAWALMPHGVSAKKQGGSDIERKSFQLRHQDSLVVQKMLASMAAQATYYVPTHVTSNRKEYLAFDDEFSRDPRTKYTETIQLLLWRGSDWLHTLGYDEETEVPILKEYYERGLEMTGLAHKSGVKIMAGTDALDRHVYYGFSLHDELHELVKAGLTNAEALQAATLEPARYYGVSDQWGTIEVGKRADLLFLKKNPMEDIRNTQTITNVMFNNSLYESEDVEAMKSFVHRQAKSFSISCKFIWNMIKS